MNARERSDLEALLGEFSRSLEEANRELLEEVQGEIRDLRARIAALEGQVGVARAETSALTQRLDQLEGGVLGESSGPVEASVDRATEEIRQRHVEIWERVREGDDAEEIARRTKRPVGEVRLIMRLLTPRLARGPQGR